MILRRRWSALMAIFLLVICGCHERQAVVIGVALAEEYQPAVQMAIDEINQDLAGDTPFAINGTTWQDLDHYDPRDATAWATRWYIQGTYSLGCMASP